MTFDRAEGEPNEASALSIWISVLHWQGGHHTRACLASCRLLQGLRPEVLLVDNGSPDNSGRSIAAEFPEVHLLETGANLGFAGGCNQAISYCLDKGVDWIWLLNNDTTVTPDSLLLLLSAGQANPRVGVLGALVRAPGGESFATAGAGKISFARAKTSLACVPQQEKPSKCAWISGSNLLLRSQALRQAGTFDERYFLYFEDTDLCLRLRHHGWDCLLVPEAGIEHAGGASTQGERAYWRAYYYTRNRLLFFCNHASLPLLPLGLISIAAHLIRHLLVLPFRGQHGRKQLKAELLGLGDFLCRRFGKAKCLDWTERE